MYNYTNPVEIPFNPELVNDCPACQPQLPYNSQNYDIEVNCDWSAAVKHHGLAQQEQPSIMIDRGTNEPVMYIDPNTGEFKPLFVSASTRNRFTYVKRDTNGVPFINEYGMPYICFKAEDNVERLFEFKGVDMDLINNPPVALEQTAKTMLKDRYDMDSIVARNYQHIYEQVAGLIDQVWTDDGFPGHRRRAWNTYWAHNGHPELANARPGDARFYQTGGVPDLPVPTINGVPNDYGVQLEQEQAEKFSAVKGLGGNAGSSNDVNPNSKYSVSEYNMDTNYHEMKAWLKENKDMKDFVDSNGRPGLLVDVGPDGKKKERSIREKLGAKRDRIRAEAAQQEANVPVGLGGQGAVFNKPSTDAVQQEEVKGRNDHFYQPGHVNHPYKGVFRVRVGDYKFDFDEACSDARDCGMLLKDTPDTYKNRLLTSTAREALIEITNLVATNLNVSKKEAQELLIEGKKEAPAKEEVAEEAVSIEQVEVSQVQIAEPANPFTLNSSAIENMYGVSHATAPAREVVAESLEEMYDDFDIEEQALEAEQLEVAAKAEKEMESNHEVVLNDDGERVMKPTIQMEHAMMEISTLCHKEFWGHAELSDISMSAEESTKRHMRTLLDGMSDFDDQDEGFQVDIIEELYEELASYLMKGNWLEPDFTSTVATILDEGYIRMATTPDELTGWDNDIVSDTSEKTEVSDEVVTTDVSTEEKEEVEVIFDKETKIDHFSEMDTVRSEDYEMVHTANENLTITNVIMPNVRLGSLDDMVYIAVNKNTVIPAWENMSADFVAVNVNSVEGKVAYNQEEKIALTAVKGKNVVEILVSVTDLKDYLAGHIDYIQLGEGDGSADLLLYINDENVFVGEEEMIVEPKTLKGSLEDVANEATIRTKNSTSHSIFSTEVAVKLPGKLPAGFLEDMRSAREEKGDVGLQILAGMAKAFNNQMDSYAANLVDNAVTAYLNNVAFPACGIAYQIDSFVINDEDFLVLRKQLTEEGEEAKLKRLNKLLNRDFNDIILSIRAEEKKVRDVPESLKQGLDNESLNELLEDGHMKCNQATLTLRLDLINLSYSQISLTNGVLRRGSKDAYAIVTSAFSKLNGLNNLLVVNGNGTVKRVVRIKDDDDCSYFVTPLI